MSRFQDNLIAKGYCDERGAGFCATATELPNGEYGIVALCVSGNTLRIYNVVDMKSNLGQLMYCVQLSQIKNLKIRTSVFSQVLRFTFESNVYSFTNFLGVKPALKVIEDESHQAPLHNIN